MFAAGCGAPTAAPGRLAEAVSVARSTSPPGGLPVSQVPQFVAVTFDDNFTTDGMEWAVGLFESPDFSTNKSAGTPNPGTFDGAPVRTSFPSNSTYLINGPMLLPADWQKALSDGHEIANHTVDHPDGINFSVQQWANEISACSTDFANHLKENGQPLVPIGFRSPYLHYDDNLFTVLSTYHFVWDSSIMECWGDAENGGNCAWPYTLDHGSADADTVYTKFSGRNVVPVTAHPGLWELPVAVVFVPDDALAAQYGFTPGLRQRVADKLAGAGNPNFFEQSTGKLVGMDVTMFYDAQMKPEEVTATLKYTLDLRLAGNRAPMVVVAHTHVYASYWDVYTPGISARQRQIAIENFILYAIKKDQVRFRPLRDVVAWMQNPSPLGGGCVPGGCPANSCGSVGDGCGGTLSCGGCPSGQSCNGATHVCQAVCVPTTCAAQGKSCNFISDGCGGTLNCGSCPLGQSCSSNNVCQAVCTPASCASLGKSCGDVGDGCGGTLHCGSCPSGQACSASNVCQCAPTTCAAQGKSCGPSTDGCGGSLDCGGCPSGQTCSNNACVPVGGSCNPSITSYGGGVCGATVVYNHELYACISQTQGVNGSLSSCGMTGLYCNAVPPDAAGWGPQAWQPLQSCP